MRGPTVSYYYDDMTDDTQKTFADAADALAAEHAEELRAIEADALALRQSIAERSAQTKKASVLDRLFKRSV